MDEPTALAVTAVRAVETADRTRSAWTDADRAWASRAAAETVGAAAPVPAFIARRATLALERLRERKHPVARLAHAWRWRPWVGTLLVLAAFIAGAATNAIGHEQRINVLYSPVAPIVLWNLVVYVLLAAGYVVRYGDAGAPGPLRRIVARAAGGLRGTRGHRDEATAEALLAFVTDWRRRATSLYAARAARVLHFAAAAFAAGTLAGLYVRGLGLEYRATWESTFLEPATVRAILAVVYAPGAWVMPTPVPDVAQVAAIRAPASENAAPWLHLMAATLMVVVIVPRLLLALLTAGLERHRAHHLVDDFADPYFQRLLRGFHEGPLTVVTVPYSFTPPDAATQALTALFGRTLGGNVDIDLAPAVGYGDEDAPLPAPSAAGALRVALFNATATPEREAHGRFLQAVATTPGPWIAVVDEAAFNARLDDPARLEARRALWRALAADARLPVVFVDLAQPDLADAEGALDAALDAVTT
ncbi:MAG: DUF2868 domain-containing protein [Burkholderiales bacterium]